MTNMVTAFTYISLILFPWITEIIIVTQQPLEQRYIALLVCGSIQTVISIYGAIKMGMDIDKLNNMKERNAAFMWCGSILDWKSLSTSGYIIYFLPVWTVVNMFISWYLISDKVIIPFYSHVMIYMPLFVYFPFLFMGYAYSKSSIQYESIEEEF